MKGYLEVYPLASSSSLRNYLFLLLICLSAKVSTSNESRMIKCCPPQEIFSDRSKEYCVQAPKYGKELYPSSNDANLNYGIPNCENPEDFARISLNKIKPNDYLRSPACLEILQIESSDEEVPIIVHCRLKEDDTRNETTALSFLKITTIIRCCPKDTLFDPVTRFCVPSISYVNDTSSLSSDDPFFSFLPNIDSIDFLAVKRGPPVCSSAIFDFHINSSDFIFEDRTLKVSRILSLFCLRISSN